MSRCGWSVSTPNPKVWHALALAALLSQAPVVGSGALAQHVTAPNATGPVRTTAPLPGQQGESVAVQADSDRARAVSEANRTAAEYEQAAAEAASKHALTAEQAQEMQGIWRKLVRAFHPDRCMDDPEKRKAHEWLTAEINQARDRGDIQRLREIAQNPDAFLSKHGMTPLSQDDSSDVLRLRTLLDALQQRILETLEALNTLHEAPGYELHQRMQQDSAFFATTVAQHQAALETEIAQLEAEAAQLAEEIEGLTGVAPETASMARDG